MPFTTRPVLMGTHGMVTAGHYLGAAAGLRMLQKGGNAIDAGVAAGIALNVLEPQMNGIGGEVPISIYSTKQKRVYAINGQGCAPKAATIEWFKSRGIDLIPGDGFLPATVPGAFGSWVTALMHFGRLSLKDVLEPAIELTEEGFPMYPGLQGSIRGLADKFQNQWPTSAKVYLPNGRVPEVGEIFQNKDWANTFKKTIDAEIKNRHRGREAALQAAIDCFYKGEIAERIVEFTQNTEVLDASKQRNRGLFTIEDFHNYRTKVEAPVTFNYRGYDVHKCSTWCQGMVFLQQLSLLEGYDLAKVGHNSADYIHIVMEAAKLAFADREKYYGDPDFVNVPFDKLLSKEYAAERRKLIDPEKASMELRPGDVSAIALSEGKPDLSVYTGDTTHCDAIDYEGNRKPKASVSEANTLVPPDPTLVKPPTKRETFAVDTGFSNYLQIDWETFYALNLQNYVAGTLTSELADGSSVIDLVTSVRVLISECGIDKTMRCISNPAYGKDLLLVGGRLLKECNAVIF